MLAKRDRPALAKVDVWGLFLTRRQRYVRELAALASEPQFNAIAIAKCEARIDVIDVMLRDLQNY